jgi:hypothetical protein
VNPATELERRNAPAGPLLKTNADPDPGRTDAGERVRLQFRPSSWLLVAAELVSLWLDQPRLRKRALLGLAWRLLPRRLKLVSSAAAALAFVLAAGAVAGIVLLLSGLG